MKNKLFLIFFLLCYSNIAYASKHMKAGEVLTEDSLVFNQDEAQSLAERLSDLETKEKELTEFQKLDALHTQKIEEMNSLIGIREQEILKYKELYELDESLLKTKERNIQLKKVEVAGAFIGGIIVTVGMVLLADKVNDQIRAQ